MKISLVAAVARNGAIGKDNDLLWQEPLDQRHFRALTMGHPVVMGRKTWDSLPARFRPLPGRQNVVVTRNPEKQFAGAQRAASLAAALEALNGTAQVFVIGGAQLYAQALPHADEMVLTEIDADLAGDVFFPAWRADEWTISHREAHRTADGTAFAFATYRRKASGAAAPDTHN
jgi:dihydrofolate reductase